jgi:hypothetical protein
MSPEQRTWVLAALIAAATACSGQIADSETGGAAPGGRARADRSKVLEAPDQAITSAAPAPMSDAERQLRALLDPIVGQQSARLLFVDCEAGPCTARVEARTLTALRRVLEQADEGLQAGLGFVVRAQLDGYKGARFHADLVAGTGQPRAVPASDAELMSDDD